MRYLIASLLVVSLVSCGKDAASLNSSSAKSLGDFPSPAQLARLAPARTSSGSDSDVNRLLQSDGAQYVPWPNYSSNAEVASNAAVIHPMDDSLSYVMYQVATPLVDNTDTLTEIRLDFEWTTPPTDPEGLYIGLPDHSGDHWVWLNGADANGTVLSIEDLAIHGADPATQPNGSFIAIVNFSSSEVTLNSIALRFKAPETVAGDEWLYFGSAGDPASLTNIERIQPGGGSAQMIHAGSFEMPDGDVYGLPVVVNVAGDWKLDYVNTGFHPQEIWRSELDGSVPVALQAAAGIGHNPGGHMHGGTRGVYIRSTGGGIPLYGYSDTINARISADTALLSGATWDPAWDSDFDFAAVASVVTDEVNYYYSLATYRANEPLTGDVLFTQLYTPLPTESAMDPEVIEYSTLAGEPGYYVYFAAKNRDDASFNIYRVTHPISGEPEAVVVDPAHELRFPAVSPDGRWLAYMRLPLGWSYTEPGDVIVTSLLDPTEQIVLAPNGLHELSWYDPAP